MENDDTIHNRLYELQLLTKHANELLTDYSAGSAILSNHHYAIQLRAQVLFKFHKLVEYIRIVYRLTADDATNMVRKYLE